MLGVPTRSDAFEISPEYAEAVAQEETDRQLRDFSNVFSTIYPHNHVVEAYRDTGNIDVFPMYKHIWELNPRLVPRDIKDYVLPDVVAERFHTATERFRGVLEGVQPVLDRELDTVRQTEDHRPLKGLPASVRVEETAADYVFTGSGITYKPGQGRGWRYTFNPYQLATDTLAGFDVGIDAANTQGADGLTKIVSMALLAHTAEKWPVTDLLGGSLRLPHEEGKHPFTMERQPGSPVAELVDQNHQILERSDLALRFDELYFHADAIGALIPAAGITDVERRMDYYNLGFRVSLRDLVEVVVADKGHAIINGITFEPTVIAQGDGSVDGFVVDTPSPVEITDLLGRPVQQPDGTLSTPAEWASEELRLVQGVSDRDEGALSAMLDRYNFDTSYGHPSREKAERQLRYSLRSLVQV